MEVAGPWGTTRKNEGELAEFGGWFGGERLLADKCPGGVTSAFTQEVSLLSRI